MGNMLVALVAFCVANGLDFYLHGEGVIRSGSWYTPYSLFAMGGLMLGGGDYLTHTADRIVSLAGMGAGRRVRSRRIQNLVLAKLNSALIDLIETLAN
jgi:hypothetical protein